MRCSSHVLHGSGMFVAGEWWAEYLRFYSAADIEALSDTHGGQVSMPADFEASNERLRGIHRLHCPLLDITGAVLRSTEDCWLPGNVVIES